MYIWCLLTMWCFTVFVYVDFLSGAGKTCYVFSRLQVVLIQENLTSVSVSLAVCYMCCHCVHLV